MNSILLSPEAERLYALAIQAEREGREEDAAKLVKRAGEIACPNSAAAKRGWRARRAR